MYSTSSIKSNATFYSYPNLALDSTVFTLYPIHDKDCDCNIVFKNHFKQNHFQTKEKLPKPHQNEPYYFLYQQNKYIPIIGTKLTWEQSSKTCEHKYKGHLWTIGDKDELIAVLQPYLMHLHQISRPAKSRLCSNRNQDTVHRLTKQNGTTSITICLRYINLKSIF